MDRRTVYYGQLTRETDVLVAGQSTMVGLGKLAEALLGTGGAFDGFAVTPNFPTSLDVVVNPGQVYQVEQLEGSAWSSLPVDTRQIVKQGLLLDPSYETLIPPSTPGFAVNVLVEVRYDDVDDGEVVLPYYNAANPSQPFSGPGNTNQKQSTLRRGAAAINLKYGTPATSGQQATPNPSAGWLGVAVISLAYGQTTISGASIKPFEGARKIAAKLLDIPAAIQDHRWTYALDTGLTASALVANLTPAPTNVGDGFEVSVKIARDLVAGAALTVNGFSGPITRLSGKALQTGDFLAGDIVKFVRNLGKWVTVSGTNGAAAGGESTTPAPPLQTSGLVEKTVGGTGADFADLNAAIAWLSLRRVPIGSFVIFKCAEGKFTYNQDVVWAHPDGRSVAIYGAPLKSTVPAGSVLAYSGSGASARLTDTTSNLATLRSVYATEITFAAGRRFEARSDGVHIQDLLVTTDAAGSSAAPLRFLTGIHSLTRVSVVGIGSQGGGAVFLNCTARIFGTCHFIGCDSVGFSVSDNANVSLQSGAQLSLASNGYAGIQVSGGAVFATQNGGAGGPITYARGNGSYGCDCNGAIAIFTNGSQFLSNGYAQVFASNPGYVNVSSCTLTGGTFAALATLAASINADSATVTGSGTAFRADNMSFIYRLNSTTSGVTTVATPAVGSVGNNNSFIV